MQVTVQSLISSKRQKPSSAAEWKRLERKVWSIISSSAQVEDDHVLFAIYRGLSSVSRLVKLAQDRKESLSVLLNRPLKKMKMFGQDYSNGHNTAVHFAIQSGEPQMVRVLCQAGAKISDATITYWMLKIMDVDADEKDHPLSTFWEKGHEMIQVLKEQCPRKLSAQEQEKMDNIELASSAGLVVLKACENLGLLPSSRKRKRESPSSFWDVISSLF